MNILDDMGWVNYQEMFILLWTNPVIVMYQVLMPTTMTVVSKVAAPRKESAAQAKDSNDSSGPTTTVFVGNISEKASDMLIRQLLAVSITSDPVSKLNQ